MQLFLYVAAGSGIGLALLLTLEAVRVWRVRAKNRMTIKEAQAFGFALVQAIGALFIGLQFGSVARHSRLVEGSDGAGSSAEFGIAAAIAIVTSSLWKRRRSREGSGGSE